LVIDSKDSIKKVQQKRDIPYFIEPLFEYLKKKREEVLPIQDFISLYSIDPMVV